MANAYSFPLEELPVDVGLLIISFLPPPDLRTLGKVCQTLKKTTETRSFWETKLRELMSHRYITDASFPVEQLDVRALQRLALAPYRFAHRVAQYDGAQIQPRNTRLIPTDLTAEEMEDLKIRTVGSVDDILLAPGGRYLLTISTELGLLPGAILFSVFDMAISHSDEIRARIRFLQQDDNLQPQCFFPDPNGRDTFFCVSLQRKVGFLGILVHEICLSTRSTMSLFARHQIALALSAPCPIQRVPDTATLVIPMRLHGKYGICLWNFLEDKAAHLIGRECAATEPLRIFPLRDSILLAIRTYIDVFNIPDLKACSPGFAPSVVNEVNHTTHLDMPTAYMLSLVAHHGPGSFERLLRFATHHVEVVEVAGIRPDLKKLEVVLPNRLPVLSREMKMTIRDTRVHSTPWSTVVDVCQGMVCFTSTGLTGASVAFLNAAPKPDCFNEYNVKMTKTALNNGLGLSITEHVLCPVLGRHCVLTPDGVVYVFDY